MRGLFITVGPTDHALDVDEGGYVFPVAMIPNCVCGEPLGWDGPRPIDASHWHDDRRIGCPGCSREYPVQWRDR